VAKGAVTNSVDSEEGSVGTIRVPLPPRGNPGGKFCGTSVTAGTASGSALTQLPLASDVDNSLSFDNGLELSGMS